ncbi:MAG: radical SAM protein [Patescibacteria group bacterium]|nr:radical SAM protein [Patescibacteria group bacterium]
MELTNRCNKDCQICYQKKRDKGKTIDMPLELAKDLILFAVEESVDTVVLTGGETSMYPYLNDLLSWIAENNFEIRFVIQSNGKIEEIPIELLRCFGAVHLSYEYAGSLARHSDQNAILDLACHYNSQNIYTYLFSTVHKESMSNLDKMVKLAVERNLDVGVNIFIPNDDCELAIPLNQYKVTMEKIFALYKSGKILRPTCPLYSLLQKDKADRYIGNKGGCTAGIASIVVRSNGDVIPCPFFYLVIGNVYQTHLYDIWLKSSILGIIRDRAKYDNPCASCEYLSFCGGCRARAYKKTGRVNASDPFCFK